MHDSRPPFEPHSQSKSPPSSRPAGKLRSPRHPRFARGGSARVAVVAIACGLAALTGCQKERRPPSKLSLPSIEPTVEYFVGSPLEGPTADRDAPAGAVGDAWVAEATLVALDRPPEKGFTPIASVAELVVTSEGNEAVTSSIRLAKDARVSSAPSVELLATKIVTGRQVGRFGTRYLPLPSGVTGTLRFRDTVAAPVESPTLRPTEVSISVYRPPSQNDAGTANEGERSGRRGAH